MRLCLLISLTVLVAVNPANAKEFLYIHNTNSGEISKISIPEHEVVAEIQIGKYMDYLAKSPDNKIVYVNRINGDMPGSRAGNIGTSGEIVAIDAATDKILWRMDMDGMTHHMSVSKDGKLMFVPYYDTWHLAVVDLDKREIIKKIFIGHGGHGTKLSADGKRLYVGSMMNDALIVIDTKKLEVIDRYNFRDGVRPFCFPKDESVIYVQQSWLHGFIVVDPKTREQKTVKLPDLDLGVPEPVSYPHNVNHGIALKPGEKELWVNGSALDFVAVYSHPELEFKTTIPVGKDPNSMKFNGDGSFIYISNRKEDTLSIIDTSTYKEIKRLKLGKLPQRMVVVDIPE